MPDVSGWDNGGVRNAVRFECARARTRSPTPTSARPVICASQANVSFETNGPVVRSSSRAIGPSFWAYANVSLRAVEIFYVGELLNIAIRTSSFVRPCETRFGRYVSFETTTRFCHFRTSECAVHSRTMRLACASCRAAVFVVIAVSASSGGSNEPFFDGDRGELTGMTGGSNAGGQSSGGASVGVGGTTSVGGAFATGGSVASGGSNTGGSVASGGSDTGG